MLADQSGKLVQLVLHILLSALWEDLKLMECVIHMVVSPPQGG